MCLFNHLSILALLTASFERTLTSVSLTCKNGATAHKGAGDKHGVKGEAGTPFPLGDCIW